MLHINEWMAPPPAKSEAPPPAAVAAQLPAQSLASDIRRQLMSLSRPHRPVAVHFYLGEGLRWIRVGFDGAAPVHPAVVERVGSVIASCLPPADTLYFHALRPLDLLFFLKDEKAKPGQVGLGPESYGAPLDTVLKAWRLAAPA